MSTTWHRLGLTASEGTTEMAKGTAIVGYYIPQ